MLSGAGGSALLELYYKPRRERWRASALLLSEVLLNTDLALAEAAARFDNAKKLPADFSFSLMAWDVVAPRLSELPPELLKRVLHLYNRYRTCNHAVELHAKAVDERTSLPKENDERRKQITVFLNSTIDVFYTALDAALEDARDILPNLLELGGGRRRPRAAVETVRLRIEQYFAERDRRRHTLERSA
jgi:hypothetical protein